MIRRLLSAAAAISEGLISALPGAPAELTQSKVLHRTANRPWPLPEEPWLMAQTWRDLLFAHWPLPPDVVRQALPPALSPDTFDGSAWIGVTPFEVSGLRPRGGLPLPRSSRFPELNVRTYTTLDDKPGIFFLSLDAASRLAVLAARRAYRLPYFQAEMIIDRRAELIHYESRRISREGEPAAFEADYRPTGEVFHAEPGTLEYFVTERYCLYTVDDAGRPLRGEIQHPPWPLQAAEASLAVNTMTLPWSIQLPHQQPVLHFSRLQNVVIWPLRDAAAPRFRRRRPPLGTVLCRF
jgi:uncharacterized protein YqjF (DUF2071 family)